MADNPKISAGEALDSSKALTSGQSPTFFVLELSFIGWYLLTMIFYPMILYVSPYHLSTGYIFLSFREHQLPRCPENARYHMNVFAGIIGIPSI